MTVPTNKDLQDAFMEGFCYAEDVGHTTGKKLAEQAAKRYPVEAKAGAGQVHEEPKNIEWVCAQIADCIWGCSWPPLDFTEEEISRIRKGAQYLMTSLRPAPAYALREALERARYVLALFAETSVGTFGVNGVVTSKRDYAQKAVEDADAALRQSDPHVIPPEDDNYEPPEPDMNADGPAERDHRMDEARRMK